MATDRHQGLRDALEQHSEIYLPDNACEFWRWNGASPDDVRALLADLDAAVAERDALREATQGLLDALPSATTHPAIAAARAALAMGEDRRGLAEKPR